MVIADASSRHGQRPHYGHMVGHPGTAGQMLAPFDAGGRGRDGLELAAVLDRRQGFHVPRIQLAGTAEEKNHDARLRAGWSVKGCTSTVLSHQRRESQPERSEADPPQQLASSPLFH